MWRAPTPWLVSHSFTRLPTYRLLSLCAQLLGPQSLSWETEVCSKNIPYCWPPIGPNLVASTLIPSPFPMSQPQIFCHVYVRSCAPPPFLSFTLRLISISGQHEIILIGSISDICQPQLGPCYLLPFFLSLLFPSCYMPPKW